MNDIYSDNRRAVNHVLTTLPQCNKSEGVLPPSANDSKLSTWLTTIGSASALTFSRVIRINTGQRIRFLPHRQTCSSLKGLHR